MKDSDVSISLSYFAKACFVLQVALGFGPCQPPLQTLASQPPASELDGYLKELGFEGVSFEKNNNNKPLIKAEIRSRRHVFLVDTGWGMTTLTPACASGLKTLGELGVTLEDSAFGRLTNSSIALIDRLSLGRGQFSNQPAAVEKLDMDFMHIQEEGVLGLDFLRRNSCLIDCYRGKLFVHGSKPTKEQRAAMVQTLRNSGFTDVPIVLQSVIGVDARINDQPVRLVADTGANISALELSQVARLHLTATQWGAGNVIGVGKIGTHRLGITMLSKFEIGVRSWTNVHYGVAELGYWGLGKQANPSADWQGLLGYDVLQRCGAVIDLCNRRLWFRPEKRRSN